MSSTRISRRMNETTDPAMRGEMTITYTLADNEAGWRSSLAKLAALVESGGLHWA